MAQGKRRHRVEPSSVAVGGKIATTYSRAVNTVENAINYVTFVATLRVSIPWLRYEEICS